jgi:adenosylmethionine-8-amino-7-oxononanoate aminotransferase
MMRAMPKIPAPRCYLEREIYAEENDDTLGLRYAENLREEILKQGAESVLAFVYEPVGGASTGALVAPSTFHRRIQEICREFGILLILDEVMTGIGRTGKFLAAEHWQLEPDMIALSKGLAAGYSPLGAMLASNRLVDPVLANGGFMHGFTSAGNPLSCAAGLAVLNELDSLDLVNNCEQRGIELKAGLEKLMTKYAFIGDVRGKGLLQAFELVSDRETMVPLPRALNAHLSLVDIAYENGLIIYSRRTRGGVEGDHFLVCPPLSVTPQQISDILGLLDLSLKQFADVLKSSPNYHGTSR